MSFIIFEFERRAMSDLVHICLIIRLRLFHFYNLLVHLFFFNFVKEVILHVDEIIIKLGRYPLLLFDRDTVILFMRIAVFKISISVVHRFLFFCLIYVLCFNFWLRNHLAHSLKLTNKIII